MLEDKELKHWNAMGCLEFKVNALQDPLIHVGIKKNFKGHED